VVEDLSEAWWARQAWPAWMDLLNDVEGIFMVDGEKSGIDSTRRRNMDRQHNPDGTSRKKTGKKLDLICRDEIQKQDWMVVERMRTWDTKSTKYLKEVEHVVIRETATITQNRISDAPSAFRDSCRFSVGYAGGELSLLFRVIWIVGYIALSTDYLNPYYLGRGFTTIQMRPVNRESYVLLMQRSPLYVLPAEIGDLRSQFRGLVRIIQTRVCVPAIPYFGV
jgi:hypothetical protein